MARLIARKSFNTKLFSKFHILIRFNKFSIDYEYELCQMNNNFNDNKNCLSDCFFDSLTKERKKANTRNRFNQIPYLTPIHILESHKNRRKRQTQKSLKVSLFLAVVHKTARNRQHSMTDMKNSK